MSQQGSLSSGGSGPLSLSINNQVFTSGATYTPSAGMVYCQVLCIGAGGAGGGAATTMVSQVSGGGGGGSGTFAYQVFSAATIGASRAVIIGGGGVPAIGTTGGNGGATHFGGLIACPGGFGGSTLAAASGGFVQGGAGGGAATGGDYSSPGQYGTQFGGSSTIDFYVTGQGGPSPVGSGGVQQIGTSVGQDAFGYGAGGSGAFNGESSTQAAGGAGASGLVVVTEYIMS